MSDNDGFIRPDCESGACAEVKLRRDDVVVRNSEQPNAKIFFTYAEWQAFKDAVKSGKYD